MSISQDFNSNSSFASIRYAPSSIVLPDAIKDENAKIPHIDIEALRTIKWIVVTIKERIAAAESDSGNDYQPSHAGSPSSAAPVGANRSTNSQS